MSRRFVDKFGIIPFTASAMVASMGDTYNFTDRDAQLC